jgi:hypothetical protein
MKHGIQNVKILNGLNERIRFSCLVAYFFPQFMAILNVYTWAR